MSAWGAGALMVERRVTASPQADIAGATGERARTAPSKIPGIDTLTTWIPGEVIAAYGTIVLLINASDDSGSTVKPTALGWLIGGAVFAAVLTWLGAWSKSDDLTGAQTKEALTRTLFSPIAFAIWSFVVPASWWYSQKWGADNAGVIPYVAGLGGLAFALIAEGTVRRIGK